MKTLSYEEFDFLTTKLNDFLKSYDITFGQIRHAYNITFNIISDEQLFNREAYLLTPKEITMTYNNVIRTLLNNGIVVPQNLILEKININNKKSEFLSDILVSHVKNCEKNFEDEKKLYDENGFKRLLGEIILSNLRPYKLDLDGHGEHKIFSAIPYWQNKEMFDFLSKMYSINFIELPNITGVAISNFDIERIKTIFKFEKGE